MQKDFIPILKWQLYRWSERLGLVGALALIILLTVIVLFFTWMRPVQAKLNQLQGQIIAPLIQAKKVTVEDQLKVFLKQLPPIAQRAESVQAVMDIAENQQLMIDEVRYKTENSINDAISHYHVEFNLTAEYSEIQRFLSELQYQLRFVSVETIRLKRTSVEDDLVEASIHLILHFNQS